MTPPTASLRWRRRPASRTSPFPGRGTAAAREQEHLLGDFLHPLGGGRLQDPRRILPRQPRSAQILTADSVQQQPIEAPEGSEINHGIHRNTRKRESESTSPCRVLPGATPARRVGSFRGYAFVMIFLAVVIPRDGPAQHPERDEALEAAARLPVRPGPRWLT